MSKKKIIVSKAIDNTISSIALGLSFVVLGVLLSYPTSSNLSAFLNPVLGYFLLLIGVTGLFLSFKDETSTIKGSSDVGTGILVLGIAAILPPQSWFGLPDCISGAAILVLYAFGLFGFFQGVAFFLYSSLGFIVASWGKNKKDATLETFELLTKLASLGLVLTQILKTAFS